MVCEKVRYSKPRNIFRTIPLFPNSWISPKLLTLWIIGFRVTLKSNLGIVFSLYLVANEEKNKNLSSVKQCDVFLPLMASLCALCGW